MSMTDDNGPIKPQSEVLYLLGGLNAKMDAVLTTQSGYETRLQAVEHGLTTVQAREADAAPKAPWWSIASGLSSAVVLIGALVTLVVYLTH